MPFWWNRRRKPWYGRWKRRRRRYPYKTRRRRFTRRRNRKSTRRRRRRKHKVRRKKKTIAIRQWQPESIRKCKIKGYSTLVLGAEGRQAFCWTNESSEYIQPKAPGGGGFGCEVITLKWLFQEEQRHNCIWTETNNYKDLCRYTGGKIYLFRHPEIDFIFNYSITPPFEIDKFTYTSIQPQNLLLARHKKVVLSMKKTPTKKPWVTVKFKCPKLMSTKWFFQRDFCKYPLIQLQAAAADMGHPNIGPLSQSQMITINYLNTVFYPHPNWWPVTETAWSPIPTISYPITGTYKDKNGQDKTVTIGPFSGSNPYYQSINYTGGWFDARLLNSYKIAGRTGTQAALPIAVARYNPNEDTGEGNEVYLVALTENGYKPPTVTPNYIIRGLPLWMAFFGYINFIKYVSKDKTILQSHMFVVKCPAIKRLSTVHDQQFYPLLDPEFIAGKLPFDEYLDDNQKKLWYPTAARQITTINALVESGPYVPKLTNLKASTWELRYKYCYYFKWGGPQVTDKAVDDPEHQGYYPIPSGVQQTVQVADPEKQTPETMFHDWDYRRGIITQTAIKRMSENIQIDSDLESFSSETPRKKRKITKEIPHHKDKEEKIKKCLLSLCEEPTCQDQNQDILQLIQHQQQQQQKLKHNIFQLLSELKKQQRCLQLQTGVLE
nr:MAG: ORF1 [Torque teno midi virus]